jgi:hypothetical protein
MLTSLTIWNSFQSYANTFQGGWFRPNTDFMPAVNDTSKKMWEYKTGQAEKSQEIRDHLQPFQRTKNLIVKPQSATYGLIEPPDDYGRFSSARILVVGGKCIECENPASTKTQEEITDNYFDNIEERIIELIDNQRWASCLVHLTKKPTFEKPKITEYQKGWKVAPRKVSVVVMDYYVRPKEGTFIYTRSSPDVNTGAGDYLIYDAKASQPLEWPETVLPEFIIELGVRFGIATRDQLMIAVSQQQKAA